MYACFVFRYHDLFFYIRVLARSFLDLAVNPLPVAALDIPKELQVLRLPPSFPITAHFP